MARRGPLAEDDWIGWVTSMAKLVFDLGGTDDALNWLRKPAKAVAKVTPIRSTIERKTAQRARWRELRKRATVK